MAALCNCGKSIIRVCRACKTDFSEVLPYPSCQMECPAHRAYFQARAFMKVVALNPGSSPLGPLCETCRGVFTQKYIDADRGYELVANNPCEKLV